MNIAIIPARGGSKRIPRKNIRQFGGKPVIAWPIEAAIKADLFDRIIVSTDDSEIKEVAVKYGAEAPFIRPPELSDDHAITNDVIKHTIRWLIEHGQKADFICCLYATTPFIQASYIREGHDRLLSSNKDYAFSVCSFPSAIQRALRVTDKGYIEAIWPENTQKRSQDLEETYYDAGQFYWGRTAAFLANKEMHSSSSVPVVLPREFAQDIDTPEDWRQAELLFNTLQ